MSRKTLVPLNVLALSTAPTTPTLQAGDTYFNTTDSTMYVYSGSAWIANSGGSSTFGNLDGGLPNSTYGGINPINAGGVS